MTLNGIATLYELEAINTNKLYGFAKRSESRDVKISQNDYDFIKWRDDIGKTRQRTVEKSNGEKILINELDAWEEIAYEWKKVKNMKRLVQELYEQVGGTLFFMLDYAKKNNIPLPKREGLYWMADRIYFLMDRIETAEIRRKIYSPRDPTETLQTQTPKYI